MLCDSVIVKEDPRRGTLRSYPRPDFSSALLSPPIFSRGPRANKGPGTTTVPRSHVIQVPGRCPRSIGTEPRRRPPSSHLCEGFTKQGPPTLRHLPLEPAAGKAAVSSEKPRGLQHSPLGHTVPADNLFKTSKSFSLVYSSRANQNASPVPGSKRWYQDASPVPRQTATAKSLGTRFKSVP